MLSVQQLGSLLWLVFDPRPENLYMPQAWPKKKHPTATCISPCFCICVICDMLDSTEQFCYRAKEVGGEDAIRIVFCHVDVTEQ